MGSPNRYERSLTAPATGWELEGQMRAEPLPVPRQPIAILCEAAGHYV
jgi:hypothetical protein